MKDQLLRILHDYSQVALLISILTSVLVAVIGILPSFFITAANIIFFGFEKGILISFCGEALGAMIAFLLYRFGLKKNGTPQLNRFPWLQKLLLAEKTDAFLLIFSLRLLPFVPSGLVTFGAAVGRVSILVFSLASSLGKIPALLLEGFSVYEVTRFQWQGKLILILISLAMLIYIFRLLWKKT